MEKIAIILACVLSGVVATILPSFPLVQQCDGDRGGGVCPLSNTCCRIRLPDGTITSGCIPSDLGAANGTCCPDLRTGCGVGYECQTEDAKSFCRASRTIRQDPLVPELPRYQLCHLSPYSDFQHIWRFASPSKFPMAELLYYSSHGDLTNLTNDTAERIRKVILVIHGQGRNADDYFCSLTATVTLQRIFPTDQVLILAPRFVVPEDLPMPLPNDLQRVLQWDGTDGYGPWRYGAHAIAPPAATNVSSFDALDSLVETLRVLLPQHPPLTLIGHSSGGQFVQRWALVSQEAQHVQVVVANPSSYAFLTPQRYDATTGEWRVLNDHDNCPHYNQWEWGLNVPMGTPDYVRHVVQSLTHTELIERFSKRHVVYMIGSLDRCNVSSLADENDSVITNTLPLSWWCNSHGLETTCMDQWQGCQRWERNDRYMDMLQRVLANNNSIHNHVRIEVPGVGHDHSLMFCSRQGLTVLFLSKQQATVALETDTRVWT